MSVTYGKIMLVYIFQSNIFCQIYICINTVLYIQFQESLCNL